MEKFDMLEPEDIEAEKATVNYLILQQLNRINFLMTVGLANINQQKTTTHINAGIKFGLRSIEAMMVNDLQDDYLKNAKVFKDKSINSALNNSSIIDNPVTQWYDLIVQQFPIVNLVPAKKRVTQI